FVNTLPLRLRFAPDVTFEALLHLVRVRLLRAMMHVNLPLHELIGMLRLERHRGSNPLFQVCVNHATAAPQPHSAGGCDVEVLALPSLKAAFEANIILIEGADGPKVCLEFDGDALSAADAEDILDQYECALACVARGPSLAIRDILLLQAPPRQASAEPRPAFVPVHARFEQQAARTPDAIAVIWCTHRSSYAELNARANRLAARLIDLGVGRGSLVAVCTDRRPEMVLAVLAVLKVGAAFVPVDQDNPDERLRFILDDTQARVLLTSTTLWHRFGQMPAMVVCADDDAACATYAAHDPGVAIDPADLAYGVYTSGSTGQPKCALNTHGGFANLLNWYTTGLSMPADARVMLASSFGFDMTQKSLLGPLCVGAQLMMPGCRPAEHHAFTHALAACRPTWLSCAPSAFRSFMDSPATESIGTLVLGGEPLDGAIVSALRGKAVTLVNSYGPSECSDIAIWCARSMHLADADDTAMPLGRPVPHVRIHVLDERLRQVPTGVTGDLYIAGAGVGRGYLHRPDLTAERFLPDPFGEPGSRMYKTGDLGRRRRDGVFEYLGRADDQVKLRGNRVEPGEVENSLRACDGVKECVVMLRELAPGESHLVAYIVARDAHMIDTDTLRHALRRQLPDYMVPTAWVTLPALPLNLNGKVDRKALPLPLRGPDTERAITLPRTPTEACLADIWKTVLDVPQVCVFDNFFDLWGQSLLAVKVAALVAQRLGVPLPTRAIFDAENLAALAALIDQTPAVKVTPACQPIKRQARQPMGQGVPEAPIT
ncbi:MAG TPA: amino acid adenylation domain-containing protein, partial [Burkholderiaceae bacterium]|nr:amino acid adenylation domain-containing protein [Burkholderiaceae bacterium]